MHAIATLKDFDKLEDTPTAAEPVQPTPTHPIESNRESDLFRAKRYAAAFESVAENCGRNTYCVTKVFALRDLFPSLDFNDIYTVMSEWNFRNMPPLSDSELRSIISNGFKYQKNQPGCKATEYKPRTGKEKMESKTPQEFNEFIPLDTFDCPEFPVDAMPEPLRSFSVEISESLKVPVDLPALLSLAAVSLFAQNRFTVEAKADWEEQVCIWVAIAMESGQKKSATFAHITEPIKQIESELIKEKRELVQRNKSDYAILEKRKAELEKKMVKGDPDTRILLNEVLREIANFKHQYEPTLLAGDITPEAVSRLLSENDGRLGIFSTEGGLFATFGGRYQDNAPVNDVFLAGHSGDPIRVNRVGRPAEHIDKPAITMALTIQPTILENLNHSRMLIDSGLLGRFCFAMPKGGEAATFDTRPISAAARDAYHSLIQRLHQHSKDNPGVIKLQLEPDAVDTFRQFYNDTQKRLFSGDLAAIPSWGGKMCGLALRIAAIFQLSEHFANYANVRLIDKIIIINNNIKNSIQICKYLGAFAKFAFQSLGQDDDFYIAKKIADLLHRERPESITQRQLYERIKGLSAVSGVSDIIPAIEKLVEQGYLKPGAPSEGVGRKSVVYEVNPEVYK